MKLNHWLILTALSVGLAGALSLTVFSTEPDQTKPAPTITPPNFSQEYCPTTVRQTTTLAYILSPDSDEELITLSGTVYASDRVTPMPDVLLEVWRDDSRGDNEPLSAFLFRGQHVTDAAGRYEFTTAKPHANETVSIHYRVGYSGNTCPLLVMQLYLAGVPAPSNGSANLGLSGPIDLVVPVAPPPVRRDF